LAVDREHAAVGKGRTKCQRSPARGDARDVSRDPDPVPFDELGGLARRRAHRQHDDNSRVFFDDDPRTPCPS